MKIAKRYTPGLLKQKCGLRFWVYFIVIMIGIYLFCGMPVHASLGYYEVQDLYQDITDNVTETNELLSKAFEFTQVSPYDVLNKAPGDTQKTAKAVRDASKTAALAVATLLLMIEFLRKSITFEWSSKWENILIFLIKILVVKQIVQNADVIMGYVYSGFQYVNDAATGGTINFLPCGDIHDYIIYAPYRGDTVVEWVCSFVDHVDIPYDYHISKEAISLFYSNFTLPPPGTYNVEKFACYPPAELDLPSFTPLIESLKLQPYFWIMKAIAVVIFIIAIGRVFELTIYTILAPIPMATFASDTTHDIAKNFLKNYVAVVLQVTVIVVMFIVYSAVTSYFTSLGTHIQFIQIVTLISLGLGVVKSGTWSKRVCGIS